MSSWRPMLRLAWRDARGHLARTLLAVLLIALPVAVLTAYQSVTTPGSPSREVALASIPEGAQAVITATAIPRSGPPFAQLPEGAPRPWIDDQMTVCGKHWGSCGAADQQHQTQRVLALSTAGGQQCPDDQVVHAAAARQVGVPLQWVNQLSGAGFRDGIRIGSPFWTWQPPMLIEPAALLATGVPGALGAGANPMQRAVSWAPIVLLALVAIAAASISVLLSATQGRRDALTAAAVGADRPAIIRIGLARAAVILALGVPLGIGAGITLASYQVAWNRHLEASGA
ncbi:MAG: hypothetical protein ACOX61_11530, partial [Brooklawnia sp.]